MSDARRRVLDLLDASDGRLLVLSGDRADRVELVGAWRIAVATRTLHALADSDTILWTGIVARTPGDPDV